MRSFTKILAGVIVVGLVVSFSCKKQEISKDETVSFLTGINQTGTDLINTTTFNTLADFLSKNPPIGIAKKKVTFKGHSIELPYKLQAKEVKGGIEDLYGTWEWQDTGWVHIDPNNPQAGILFRWNYIDTSGIHTAELLMDSIQFEVINTDTLPTRLHIALFLDGNKIAEFSYTASFTSNGNYNYLKVVVSLTGYGQVGFEFKNPVWRENGYGDYELAAFTARIWIINYTNHNYRVDLTITKNEDDSGTITFTDSDGWKLVVNVSEPQRVVENGIEYKKYNISGEITKDGRHAADIQGTVWDPSDDTHISTIYVIFTDGSREPLQNYITIFRSK